VRVPAAEEEEGNEEEEGLLQGREGDRD